jgi:hypothetical protein
MHVFLLGELPPGATPPKEKFNFLIISGIFFNPFKKAGYEQKELKLLDDVSRSSQTTKAWF